MNSLSALFFEHTLRRWHFEDLVRESKLSRERVNHFLKELLKTKLVKRVKPRNKQPYYLANHLLPKFRFEKRFYGLKFLEESGLFEHLATCSEIKTAILFGSFSRGDWGRSSDIDLFIYGQDTQFNRGKFERSLNREIQLFSYPTLEKAKTFLEPKVLVNIAKGFYITEKEFPFEVKIHG